MTGDQDTSSNGVRTLKAERKSVALRIVIVPTKSGRKWIARLDNKTLCVSAWPFVMSARALIKAGYPADAAIEMWRPKSDEFALRGRLGVVAATLIDGETASRCAKNGSPACDPGRRCNEPTEPLRSSSPRFWHER